MHAHTRCRSMRMRLHSLDAKQPLGPIGVGLQARFDVFGPAHVDTRVPFDTAKYPKKVVRYFS